MTLKLRNAFLRGWFAARSQRPMPAPDGLAEKLFLDNGFAAGIQSSGSALPLLAPVNANDLRAAWEMEFDLEKSRLQKRYLDLFMPGTRPVPVDLDLRHIASPVETAKGPEADSEPPARSRWDDEDDDAPKTNRFLPTRKYGSSMGRRARFKG